MAERTKRALSTLGNGGGGSGIVLSMNMVPTSDYAVMYTVPVQVGLAQQNFSLQVDTGSSDLWIASKSCPPISCSGTGGQLYDPSSSQSTGTNFSMQYLAGTVNGPIVWDQVQIGGYTILNQALAAATAVNDEPLSYNFDGVLGLALPLNSLILQALPASTGDTPDGATLSSNLFTLEQDAPSQAFFSLTLARPGSSRIPSLLGIGLHPPEIVSDPSHILYSPIINQNTENLFWKTTIRAITVYVNGKPHPVALQSISGAAEPTALLDSGAPLIITTPALANGIYGALGIGPAPDGNYYLPCATPLNMTISLDGQNELPLHPLDLTMEPPGQSTSQYCTGLIQTDTSQLTATSDIGDMVLGVPFMRNVYSVMAYEQPDTTGNVGNTVQSGTTPMLGLLSLTNATQAMEEFNQVRLLKQPLDSGSSRGSLTAQDSGSTLSIGVKVLIGLVGFFALSLALFALRCILARRRWQRRLPADQLEPGDMSNPKTGYGAYGAPRSMSPSSLDTLNGVEFGMPRSKQDDAPTDLDICDPWNPHAGTWPDTIIGTDAGESASFTSSYFPPPEPAGRDGPGSPPASPDLTSGLLAAHDRSDSQTSDLAEFGMHPVGMAGIGTAARGSIIDADLQSGRLSYDSARSSLALRHTASSLRSMYTLAYGSADTEGDVDRIL